VSTTHVVIPDTQAKPDAPTDHLGWIGQYIIDQFAGDPDVKIIHVGDHWDMPSLSSYDKGTKKMEGRRYVADVEAGNDAWRILTDPLEQYNRQRARFHEKQWNPERHLLRGNHEDRITRATNADAQLDGLLSLDDLESPGWQVHEFLEPVFLDGVGYAHFWANPMTGKPYGGMALTRLKQIGHSFTMGHVQTLDYAIRFVNGMSQHALIAGACYLHDEDYKGPQGNAHWRGIIVCHQVESGAYDPMFVSLDYLCRRYEGQRLEQFTGPSSWRFNG
jgi:hypothetical protein